MEFRHAIRIPSNANREERVPLLKKIQSPAPACNSRCTLDLGDQGKVPRQILIQ
jgi:hypothetical protein